MYTSYIDCQRYRRYCSFNSLVSRKSRLIYRLSFYLWQLNTDEVFAKSCCPEWFSSWEVWKSWDYLLSVVYHGLFHCYINFGITVWTCTLYQWGVLLLQNISTLVSTLRNSLPYIILYNSSFPWKHFFCETKFCYPNIMIFFFQI